MREPERIRVAALVEDHYATLLGLCVAVAVVGGAVTYAAHAGDTTRTRTEQVTQWTSTGEFTHEATVRETTELYPSGHVLRNRTTYLRTLAPVLNATFDYRYRADDGGNLTTTTRVVLVLRSTETRGGETVRYWRTESELAASRTRSVRPGETVRVPFSLNASRVRDRLDRIDRQVGGSPGTLEPVVEVRLDVLGTRAGRPVDAERTYRLPITVRGNVYRVDDPGRVTESGSVRREVRVADPPDPATGLGGPALAGLGLAGAGVLALGRARNVFTTTERERERLAHRRAREEFEEWITAADLSDADPERTVAVESLEGLVDVAVDTDGRVLFDRSSTTYAVFDGARTYVYTAPEGSARGHEVIGPAAPETPSDTGVDAAGDGESDGESDRADDGTVAPPEPPAE